MNDFNRRTEKVIARIRALAAVSEDPHCLTRTFGTGAFLAAAATIRAWMDEAGLHTRIDNIGNVRGRLVSPAPGAKTVVIASHFDTVINAGSYDGPLGIIMGLDLLDQLILHKTTLPFHLELIAFSDEEGVRFHSTFLGSRVVAGSFDDKLLQLKDAAGHSLHEVIVEMGGNPAQLGSDAMPPGGLLAYFEIHIEQGPVLYDKNIPVALVTAIAGQKRMELTFTGTGGHAGTVPMHLRHDALCCAAAFILETEKTALTHQGGLVATVGKLNIHHAAGNVIPGEVVCTLDMRSDDAAVLENACHTLQQSVTTICAERKVTLQWNLVQQTDPVPCDALLNQLLASAISASGFDVVALPSGAGHDAVPVSAVAPVCMLFVRCFEGISHHPLENVSPPDIAAGLQIAETFLHELIKKYT